MNKKRRGFLLLEALLQTVVLSVLAAGILLCFSATLKLQRQSAAEFQLQGQLRFAVAGLMRDLMYAEAVEIGERRLVIYRKNGQSAAKIVYAVKNERLTKDGQPITGDENGCEITITDFTAWRRNNRTVLIRLAGRHKRIAREFALETAAVLLNADQPDEALLLP